MTRDTAYRVGLALGLRHVAPAMVHSAAWVNTPPITPVVPRAWETVLQGAGKATESGRADALNRMIRTLVGRAPKQFKAMRGALGGTKNVMKAVYPTLLKALQRVT